MADPVIIYPNSSPFHLVQARHGWMLANKNDFYLGGALLKYGEYAEQEFALLAQIMFRPGCVLEVGANMGTHTISLAKLLAGNNRRLIAFEPQPFVFHNLCGNLALNGLSNVRAWPYACSDETTTLYFDVPDYGSTVNTGGIAMRREGEEGRLAVPCVRLDDMEGTETVSLIKIDAEGFELNVLRGAEHILAQSRPVLYMENSDVEKSSELIEWIWSKGYSLWWHTPSLFNPDNYFGVSENLYPDLVSCNMLAIPAELSHPVSGLDAITDSHAHPFSFWSK